MLTYAMPTKTGGCGNSGGQHHHRINPKVGERLSVWDESMDGFNPGVVTSFSAAKGEHTVTYGPWGLTI